MTFADMARTVLARQDRNLQVITDPTATYFGHPIDDTTLVPRRAAELGFTSLADRLTRG